MAASDRQGYYDDLDFNSPMTEVTATELVAMLERLDPLRVVDVGCGWAELLLRLLEARPNPCCSWASATCCSSEAESVEETWRRHANHLAHRISGE